MLYDDTSYLLSIFWTTVGTQKCWSNNHLLGRCHLFLLTFFCAIYHLFTDLCVPHQCSYFSLMFQIVLAGGWVVAIIIVLSRRHLIVGPFTMYHAPINSCTIWLCPFSRFYSSFHGTVNGLRWTDIRKVLLYMLLFESWGPVRAK